MRSVAFANGTCALLRRQFAKQHPRVHHAMQNSLPASLCGGGWSRRIGRVPPGRTAMPVKSASCTGLSTLVTAVRVSAVIEETHVFAVVTVLPPVATALGAREPPPLDRVVGRGGVAR